MGMLAGRLGDAWNLGFLAETERQVEAHLTDHLRRLPAADRKSAQVLEQMREDEVNHAETAVRLGARELPLARAAGDEAGRASDDANCLLGVTVPFRLRSPRSPNRE